MSLACRKINCRGLIMSSRTHRTHGKARVLDLATKSSAIRSGADSDSYSNHTRSRTQCNARNAKPALGQTCDSSQKVFVIHEKFGIPSDIFFPLISIVRISREREATNYAIVIVGCIHCVGLLYLLYYYYYVLSPRRQTSIHVRAKSKSSKLNA